MADAAAQFLTPAQYGDLEILNTNDIDGDVLSLMSPRVFVNAGSLYHVKDMRELARIVNSTISTVPEVFLGKL